MTRIGKCCCEDCQIQVIVEPTLHGVCNCNNCKRRTGSAFGISAYFPENKFTIICGSTNVYELTTEHGKQQRYFCSRCGTTLYWRADIFKGFIGVAGGCFTDNPLAPPSFNATQNNQCSWVTFPASMDKPLTAADIPSAK